MNPELLAYWIKQVERADQLAEIAHSPQKRWDGTDYIVHPRIVAERAFRCAVDGCLPQLECLRIKIIGLLHDVVEDTPITPSFISRTFGQPISKSVLILTRPNTGDLGPEYEPILYKQQLAHASFREIIVKLADVWQNATTPAADERRARSWVFGSAQKTLGVYRRWMEANSGTLSPELLESVEKLYGEANDACDALLSNVDRKKRELLDQVEKIQQNVETVSE